MNPRSLRLEPIFVPRIWGSRCLAPLFPERAHLSEPIGEAWLTGHECRFSNGPFTGKKLGDAWPGLPMDWVGRRVGRSGPFPLLVKFIFPEEKLSVQVHPDDEYARIHEPAAGGLGKTEIWYVVSARPGAKVMVGTKPEIDAKKFRQAIAQGAAEQCLCEVTLEPGDAVFVPAGTAHTIGPGLVLCEIQEHSDITYRVFDFNRRTPEGKPRELHIERALEVIRFGEQVGGKLESVRVKRGPVEKTHYVACRYFAVEKWEFAERIAAVTSPEHFDLLIVLKGAGKIEAGGESLDYAPAQTWLLPASLGAYQIAPGKHTAMLRTYVPPGYDELIRRLADEGVSEAAWSRLIYP